MDLTEINAGVSVQRHALDPMGRAVLFSVGDRSFIFDGHNGRFIDAVPAGVADYLAGGAAGAVAADVLRHTGWLEWLDSYREGVRPDLQQEQRQAVFLQGAAPERYVICLSQACNLACSYCVNQRGSYGGRPRLMQPSTARECVTFLQQQLMSDSCSRISTVLFGGEPLLAMESTRILVDGLLEGQRLSGKPVGAILCTNGTFFDEDLFRTFAVNSDSFSVAISIDGSQENHDKHRPFAATNGQSSWLAAVQTVRRLVEANVRVSVTCVVAAPYEYIERAQDLQAIGLGRIEIKQVIPHVYGCAEKPDVLQSDFEQWRRQYMAYTDWCLERGGLLPPADVVHIDRVVLLREYSDRIDTPSARRLGCAAADEGAAIDADGRIFPCDAFIVQPALAIGTVTSGIDPEKRESFARWLIEKGQHRTDAPKCSACYAKRFCGGGCYATSYDATGELSPMDDDACAFVREKVLIDLYFISRVTKENPDGVARVFKGRNNDANVNATAGA